MENIKLSNYNYDSIKYFISVAKHGSLSLAAKSLGISQSALSQSMKNLEQSLTVTLFNRNTRGVILTEEGRVLYEQASIGDKYFKEAIVDTLRKKTFESNKIFKISISTSLSSIFFNDKIRQIQEILSDINLQFVKQSIENEIVELLQTGAYDLIILKSTEDFNLKEIEMKKISTFNYVFSYNPLYYKLPETLSIEELSKFCVIMKERTGRNDNTWIKYSFNKFIDCRNDNQCLELIKSGAGIGIYPKELLETNKLKMLNVEKYKPTKRIVYACYLQSNLLAKKVAKELSKLY